jgi:curli biogenesis system outer membrane secretion channel CsgG
MTEPGTAGPHTRQKEDAMTPRLTFRITLFSCIAALAVPASEVRAQEGPPARPSVTVADFATDRTTWMPPPGLGQTLAELLTDRLVAAGTLRIKDREWLVTASEPGNRIPLDVLVERAAGASVDFLVVGAVTRLSTETRSSTSGGILPVKLLGALVRRQKVERVVGLAVRVIDVRTGDVVATAIAEGAASRKGTAVGGLAGPAVAGRRTSVTGGADVLLDRAVQDAVTIVADRILETTSRFVRQGGRTTIDAWRNGSPRRPPRCSTAPIGMPA